MRVRDAWPLVVCVLTIVGCSGENFENRQAVEGTVTIDGQPLEKALITFIPMSDTEGPKSTGVIENGRYTIPAEFGPCAGEFQVKLETISPEIEALASGDTAALHRAIREGGETINIAPQYNRDSQLKATVRDDGPNHFDFAVEQARVR